jgi:hypothetical protein
MALAPEQVYLSELATEGPIVPHHSEDDTFVICWRCHLWLIAPPERRLCQCEEPSPVSLAEADRLQALEALRDALAATYRRRWFKVLLPLLDDADKSEGLAAWEGLWSAAQRRAANRLAESGLS